MHTLEETVRKPAPAGRPMPITVHDSQIWVGCWDTARLYALDPLTLTVKAEYALPGKPYGLTAFEGKLHATISVNDADDRYIYSFTPGTEPNHDARIPCPEYNGSHLATDGTSLYLVQQTNGRVVELSPGGEVVKSYELPTRCAGLTFARGAWFMISADEEFDELHLAALDLSAAVPEVRQLAEIAPDARGLAFDGNAWWTCYRELNEIVSLRD